MLKKIILLAVVSISLIAGNIILDLNAKYGVDNFHTIGAKKFARLVDEYTNGSVKIAVHTNSFLVSDNILKSVKDGTISMADMFLPFTTTEEKVFGISTLPFVCSSYDDAYRLYQLSKLEYDKAVKKWNQKILYAVTWPPSGIYSKKEIKKASDLKQMIIRTYDKNSAHFVSMVGGRSISLPWEGVYPALQTGMVNSVITSSASGKDGKFWKILDYFTQIDYAYPLQAITINLDYWNALSKIQQEAMLKAAKEIETIQWQISEEENSVALEVLATNGIKIKEASSKLKVKLNIIGEKFLSDYLEGADESIKDIFTQFKGL